MSSIRIISIAIAIATSLAYGQKVALVVSRDILPYQAAADGFKRTCGEAVSVYNLDGDPGKGGRIFSEIGDSRARLVVTVGSEALESALAHTKLPVVYTMVLEPKNNRAGMTGVTLEVPLAVQLKYLREAVPSVRTVGLVYNPVTGRRLADQARSACQSQGMALESVASASDREVAEALRPLAGRIDAIWMVTDQVNLSPMGSEAILLFGLENKLSILAPSEKFVKGGALISVAADYGAMGEQAGRMANSVIRGTDAGSLPDEQPQKYNVTVNLNVARQIGLEIPEAVVRRASKVYQ